MAEIEEEDVVVKNLLEIKMGADLEDEEGRLYGDGGGDDHDAGSTTRDSSMAVDAVAAITTSGNPTANQNATQYKSALFSDQKFGDLPASFSTPAAPPSHRLPAHLQRGPSCQESQRLALRPHPYRRR